MYSKKHEKSVMVKCKEFYKIYCTCGSILPAYKKLENYACLSCKKIAEIDLTKSNTVYQRIVTKKENDKDITYRYEVTTYESFDMKGNIEYKSIKKIFNIKLNKKTGEGTIWRGNKMEKLVGARSYSDLYYQFISIIRKDLENQLMIIKTFFEARGIRDLNPEEFYNDRFYKLFLFTKCPNMQHFGTSLVTIVYDHEIIKMINKSNKKIELFENLTGHKSKRIRKLAEDIGVFNFLLVWGKYIDSTDILIELIGKVELKDNREIFETTLPEANFIAGIDLIKSFHQGKSDAIWINRLLKVFFADKKSITERALIHYVEDIGRMELQLHGLEDEFTIPFSGDIKKLHDDLAILINKVKTDNRKIKYNENELSLEKEFDEGKRIVLAPDTHYLVEVGTKMNICVGSYRDKALSKICNIAVLKQNNEPMVCIEIQKNKLIQAKMKYNKKPTGDYKKDVISWCVENEIEFENCYDIA